MVDEFLSPKLVDEILEFIVLVSLCKLASLPVVVKPGLTLLVEKLVDDFLVASAVVVSPVVLGVSDVVVTVEDDSVVVFNCVLVVVEGSAVVVGMQGLE